MSNASEANRAPRPCLSPEAGAGQVASADAAEHRTAGALIALGAAAMVVSSAPINLTQTTLTASASTASAFFRMPPASSPTAASSGMASTTARHSSCQQGHPYDHSERRP